jgi:hypothetical protein
VLELSLRSEGGSDTHEMEGSQFVTHTCEHRWLKHHIMDNYKLSQTITNFSHFLLSLLAVGDLAKKQGHELEGVMHPCHHTCLFCPPARL